MTLFLLCIFNWIYLRKSKVKDHLFNKRPCQPLEYRGFFAMPAECSLQLFNSFKSSLHKIFNTVSHINPNNSLIRPLTFHTLPEYTKEIWPLSLSTSKGNVHTKFNTCVLPFDICCKTVYDLHTS